MTRVKIPLTWQYLLAFFCLGTLLGIGHELAHHVAGWLVCGEWGYKTFNSFKLAPGCVDQRPDAYWLATLAGPVLFNYIPMWYGVRRVRQDDLGEKLFGVSLIFATVPILRIAFNLVGANDESAIVRELFGRTEIAHWTLNALIWAVAVPPLVIAWRTIGNRLRPLVFLLFFVGVPGLVALFFGGVLERLIEERRILPGELWGMPYLVLLTELLATIGYMMLKPRLRAPAP
jgi:hypothetical protein